MTIRPLADRVLVKSEQMQQKSAGGIYIPETAQEKTQIATVIAVGEGTDKVKMTIKAGDKILHDKFAGVQVKSEGEEYLILKMEDVLAVIC